MAQTGYTPILIYSSTTASQAPAAGNLTNSTLGSELAINITDGKLFYKDNSGSVQVIAWKVTPTSAGGTGLTSYTAGDTLYYATGTTLSKLAIGTAYQMLGVNAGATAPSWQPSATSVLTTQGDLLYASAANTLARLGKNTTASRYLSNSGTSNNPAWAQVDLTNGVTGTLPVANGGTNLTSFTANGLVYASSTSALATGSAITFDGTNFATTGTASATKFIPTAGAATGNGMYLFATNSLGWSTNGTKTMGLDATGNLLVSPNGTATGTWGGIEGIQIDSSTTDPGLVISTGGVNKSYLYYATGVPSIRLQSVSGVSIECVSNTNGVSLANGGTSWGSLSDERKKDIIEPITNAITKVNTLRSVIGKYKTDDEGTRRSFLIAQDVEAVLPEAIDATNSENLSLRYTEVIPLLVAAIKEQSIEIEFLKTEITKLKGV